jgi:uncharacterized protein YutE (UPF0331/DUF86 family)
MVDANIVAEKLKQLALRIAKVRAHCPPAPGDLAPEGDRLDLVSFNLFLAVQTCLDLATHLIADEGWAPAATAREAFERLAEHGVIAPETARSLHKAVGLRVSPMAPTEPAPMSRPASPGPSPPGPLSHPHSHPPGRGGIPLPASCWSSGGGAPSPGELRS